MRPHSVLYGVSVLSCVFAMRTGTQSGDPAIVESPTVRTPDSQTATLPALSPGADEIAKLLEVAPLLERLSRLDNAIDPSTSAGLETLVLRQTILEAVVGASLDADGVIAEIDSEMTQIGEARAYIESRRDRALAINTLASIVTGGMTGVIGTLLQFKESTSKVGNAIGATGGGTATVLSVIGLRQQRGGQRSLGRAPNMLAKLFERTPEFHGDYPPVVWQYLTTVPPGEPGPADRRQRLIAAWTEQGRIEPGSTPSSSRKIDLLTSGVSDRKALTLDLLEDRNSMLSDVRAAVALLKRDLSKLMLAVRSHR